jgi:hypothetical protein
MSGGEIKSPFSRSSFCDFDVSQLANTSCNKAQSAVRKCISVLSQHSVRTLSALCQRYVRTLSAFKQYSESLCGLIKSLSGLGPHYQNHVRVMSGVVRDWSGVVRDWSGDGLGLVWDRSGVVPDWSGIGLGLVWDWSGLVLGWSGVLSTLSALFHRIVRVLLSN